MLPKGKPGITIEPDPVDLKFGHAEGRRSRFLVEREIDGQPLGYLSFYLDDALQKVAPPEHGLFPEVYVSPAARRKGVASRLYAEAERLGYDLSAVSGTETTPTTKARGWLRLPTPTLTYAASQTGPAT